MSELELLFDLSCLQKKFARKRFRKQIFEEWGSCAYCCRSNPTTLDHVIPKARGGSTTKGNLVACCGDCNLLKADSDVLEWWRTQSFWTLERETALFVWLSTYHPVAQEPEPVLRDVLMCSPLLLNVA